jgi:hypothetical protein
VTLNRLAVVGAGTMFWMVVLQAFLPGFNLGHAIVLAVWIAMGSPYYARSFVDFKRPIRLTVFFGLLLMSPGWPITYWQSQSKK